MCSSFNQSRIIIYDFEAEWKKKYAQVMNYFYATFLAS
jgi:hypothetical protein